MCDPPAHRTTRHSAKDVSPAERSGRSLLRQRIPPRLVCHTSAPMNIRFHDAAEKLATHATLRAVRVLSRVLDSQLQRLRKSDDALTQALARVTELEVKNGILKETIEAFQARLRKLAPKKRPHYTGPARFKALEVRQAMGWSIEEAASEFVVSEHTFARWEDAADPIRKTVGPDIQPIPPLRRYADVVRALVRFAERLGMGRSHSIAAHVARGGWDISKSYVESVLKSEPTEPILDLDATIQGMPLKGEFRGHVYILDSHEVKAFLGHRKFFVTAVKDAYSHAPLGLHASQNAPTAVASANLLQRVCAIWGKPKYVAIDGGSEFRGVFRKAVKTAKAHVRLGAPGKTTVTGLIERFWRTLDALMTVKLNPPTTLADLERRLASAIAYYVQFRPIFALDAATPAERLNDVEPLSTRAVQPPRAMPGIDCGSPPMRLAWLIPNTRELPYFQPA